MSVAVGSSIWAAPVAAAGHVFGAKVISVVLLFPPQERLTGGLGLLLPSLEK